MQFPPLKAGQRHTLPRPFGSADALALGRLAEREQSQGRLLAIVTTDTSDAQRLQDELAFFSPGVRTALFPD